MSASRIVFPAGNPQPGQTFPPAGFPRLATDGAPNNKWVYADIQGTVYARCEAQTRCEVMGDLDMLPGRTYGICWEWLFGDGTSGEPFVLPPGWMDVFQIHANGSPPSLDPWQSPLIELSAEKPVYGDNLAWKGGKTAGGTPRRLIPIVRGARMFFALEVKMSTLSATPRYDGHSRLWVSYGQPPDLTKPATFELLSAETHAHDSDATFEGKPAGSRLHAGLYRGGGGANTVAYMRRMVREDTLAEAALGMGWGGSVPAPDPVDAALAELDAMWAELRQTTTGYARLKVKPPTDKKSRWYWALQHDAEVRRLLEDGP